MTANKKFNIFPGTKVAAHYDQFYRMITLDSISEAQFKQFDFTNFGADNFRFYSLITHELTHWIDNMATLWGQKNIKMLFNCLNALAMGNEKEFWRIKELDNLTSADTFNEYYTETYKPINGSFKEPYKMTFTTGVRFDAAGKLNEERPILFAKFETLKDVPVKRVPVSIAAILETNAIYEEYYIKFAYLSGIEDKGVQIIETKLIEKELENLLYSNEYTLYSVIAHMTANFNSEVDAVTTYQISSSLGTLLLNIPPAILSKMTVIPNGEKASDSRMLALAKNADLGFGYYNLLKNMVTKFGKKSFSVENALAASGLPDRAKLEGEIAAQMLINLGDLIDGPFYGLATYLLNEGMMMYGHRGLDGKKEGFREYFYKKHIFPEFMFNDTLMEDSQLTTIQLIQKIAAGQELSLSDHLILYGHFEEKMIEFVKVCGV